MRRLNILDDAKDNLADIGNYIVGSSGSDPVAEAFVAKIVAHCQKLSSLPGTLGRARPELAENLRSTPFGNYIIFFRYESDTFDVVNVLHGARDIEGFYSRRGDEE